MITRLPGKSAFRLFVRLALFALGVAGSAAAKDTWIEVQSPHFKVVSNAGENEARKIADQFEQFREVFHNSFPKLRVDLGKPLVIFAVKNEDTLKVLLPAFWEVKGRMHPAGIFAPGEARHYVAVRTNIESENPYEVVYHEYTHAIMNLNFQGLPIWLGEGLAEYFGNSTIHDKEVEIGKISPYHLEVLQTIRLIPIEALMQAGADSPYYNEQNRASVFYAESWAIVHYLLMDPGARKHQMLSTFLTTWDASGNQVEAATKAFGDLKKFSSAMEGYARQRAFYVGHVQTAIHGNSKSYSSRGLSPGEVAAEEALFYIQTQRAKEAHAATEEALQADPKLALAHEAKGLIAYRDGDYATAEKEFARSLELSPTSYVSYFFEAQARLRGGKTEYEELPEITGYLEKAMALNPQFAPAYATLANFYAVHPETRDKALANAVASRENFSLETGYEARTPASNESTGEPKSIQLNEPAGDTPAASSKSTAAAQSPAAETPHRILVGPEYRLEGRVVAAECLAGREVKITLSINSVLMKFRAADLKSIEVMPANKLASADKPPCAAWKDQRAKVTFHSVPAGEFDGELAAIYFF